MRAIYEDICSGDPISDADLKKALKFFTKLEDDLRSLGPTFRLAANEAGYIKRTLEGFDVARKMDRSYNRRGRRIRVDNV